MLQRTYLLALCILFTIPLSAQNKRIAFYDAGVLKDLYTKLQSGTAPKKIPVDDPKVKAILKAYFLPGADINTIIATNSILKNYFETGVGMTLDANYDKPYAAEPVPLGSFNISAIADGITKFLIARGKEEVKIAFFSKLKDFGEKYPECKIIFPNTTTILLQFDSWSYANILNTLKEAMVKDLKGLPGNIAKLSTLNVSQCPSGNTSCSDRVAKLNSFFNTNMGVVFLSALTASDGLIAGERMPDIVEDIFSASHIGKPGILSPDQAKGVKIISVVSQALRSNDFETHYVSAKELSNLISDIDRLQLFSGLLYQQLTDAGITPPNAFDFMRKVTAFSQSLLEKADRMGVAYKHLRDAIKDGEKDLKAYYQAMFSTSASLFQVLGSVQSIDIIYQLPPEVTSMFTYINSTLTMAHDLAAANYSAALAGLLQFLTATYPSLAATPYIKEFLKYASFAANLIQAEDADQAQAAIEAIALPAGSASIKKHTGFSISLNAYLGGFMGKESFQVQGSEPQSKNSAGVYAPIGVAFNKRIWQFSLSVFGTLIDLGTFAAFRLSDPTTKELPKVTLQNIIAPGGGIVLGLPAVPLSIGYTYQYGPALRELSSGAATVGQSNHRTQFFLAVDIPLINIYSSSRK